MVNAGFNARMRPQRTWPALVGAVIMLALGEGIQIGGANNYKIARVLFSVAGALTFAWIAAKLKYVKRRILWIGLSVLPILLCVGVLWKYLAPIPDPATAPATISAVETLLKKYFGTQKTDISPAPVQALPAPKAEPPKVVAQPTLIVTPSHVTFGRLPTGMLNQETYEFRMTNGSDQDVYVSEFDFTVDLDTPSKDFAVNIPKDSRKPYGEGGIAAEKFVDTTGFFCKDIKGRFIYIMSIQRLTPHESREITFTHTKPGTVELRAKTGFFSTQPQPVSPEGNLLKHMFKFNAQKDGKGCLPFGFLVDENEHQGMYWFEKMDGVH